MYASEITFGLRFSWGNIILFLEWNSEHLTFSYCVPTRKATGSFVPNGTIVKRSIFMLIKFNARLNHFVSDSSYYFLDIFDSVWIQRLRIDFCMLHINQNSFVIDDKI